MPRVLLIGFTSLLLFIWHTSWTTSGLIGGGRGQAVEPLRRPVGAFPSAVSNFGDKRDSGFSSDRGSPAMFSEKSVLSALPLPVEVPSGKASALGDMGMDAGAEGPIHNRKEFEYLARTLRAYVDIKDRGGWPTVEPGLSLRIGDQGSRVLALRAHLEITGDLPADASTPRDTFDHTLDAAVKQFQRRHGLEADGVVGKMTLAALNIPVEARIKQLQVNLERWRSIPADFGSRYLMVNIPGFELRIVENDTVVRKMRAIVGKKRRQTPIMSERLSYLELNPYWNIPRRIVFEDMLPRILKDPEFLVRQGIKVLEGWNENASSIDPFGIDWDRVSYSHFPYRLRQDPSRINSLGQLKFMFPNQQSVYIHDTPGKNLFEKQRRTFSSGCVRVQDPLSLAEYLLKEQDWDRKKLETQIKSGQRQIIVLKETIPVHMVYFTAWIDENGEVNFREDIYGKDEQIYSDFQGKQSLTSAYAVKPENDDLTAKQEPFLM